MKVTLMPIKYEKGEIKLRGPFQNIPHAVHAFRVRVDFPDGVEVTRSTQVYILPEQARDEAEEIQGALVRTDWTDWSLHG